MKTELFREINDRFVLIEHGDPHFLAKIYDQILESLRKSLREKPFRVEDRTSIYLCHRLLFEFQENLKVFRPCFVQHR